MSLPDAALHKVLVAMQQMQIKLQDDQRELSKVTAQVQKCEREQRTSAVVSRELDTLTDDVRVYKSIGKMFMLSDLPTMKKEVSTRGKESGEQAKVLEKKRAYLERNVKEITANLREITPRA
ncbi:Prefoldin [Syncephalis fuscata]|nr:Prefoldin [Syncephalis fuscata]KAI9599312.1 Prefoldin [Syncephalis fuscata]